MDTNLETDENLVTRARGGDMDALDALVRRHQSWIFNLALRMVWRRTVAEDATQEILIKAVTKLGTFAGNGWRSSWAKFLARRARRARRRWMKARPISGSCYPGHGVTCISS